MNDALNPSQNEPAASTAPVVAALSMLVAAARANTLYGSGHAATTRRAEDATAALTALPAPAFLGLAEGRLTLPDQVLDLDADVMEFCRALDRASIASMELTPTSDGEAVAALAGVIGNAMTAPEGLADLPQQCEKASKGVMRLTGVDYTRLRMAEGAGDGRAATLADLTAATLAGPAATDETVLNLAQRVNNAETTVRAEDLAKVLRDTPATEAGRVRAKVGQFVSALDSKARRDLVAIDPNAGKASFKALADLADVLPVADVLSALDGSEIGVRSLTPETVMLLAKLAGIASHDEGLSARVRKSADEWKSAGSPTEGLRGALDDLLRIASSTGFNPQDYERRLASLSVNFSAPAEPTPAARNVTPATVRYHLALIAGEIVAQSPEQSESVVAYLVRSVDTMIEQGQIEPLAEAAHATVSFPHGQELRSALTQPERLRRIAEVGARCPSAIPAVCEVLELAGPAGAAQALVAFGQSHDAVARRRTADLIRRFAATPAALEPHVGGHDGAALAGLAALADLLPTDLVRDFISARIGAAPAEVRDEAYRRLGTHTACWTRPMIMNALGSRDPVVATLALERVDELDDLARLEVLRAYIDGAYGMPHAEVVEQAVTRMIAIGEVGRKAAADCLLSMSLKPRASAAHAAKAIATVLQSGPQDGAAKRALRAWSLIPTRWLGLFSAAKGGAR